MTAGNGTAKAGRRRTKAEAAPGTLENRLVEQIKKAVIEEVMGEIRPLLQELAELSRSRKPAKSPADAPTSLALQEQALERMEEMKKKIAERVRLSEARIFQRSKKRQ